VLLHYHKLAQKFFTLESEHYAHVDSAEDGKNDIIRRVKAKVMFDNQKQLLVSNDLSLEIKKETYKKLYLECCSVWIRNVDPRKYEERVVNAFETWSWKRMLKIKWTDRMTNDEAFQRAREERFLLKILKTDATHG